MINLSDFSTWPNTNIRLFSVATNRNMNTELPLVT